MKILNTFEVDAINLFNISDEIRDKFDDFNNEINLKDYPDYDKRVDIFIRSYLRELPFFTCDYHFYILKAILIHPV